MRKFLLLLVALGLWSRGLSAQKPSDTITVPTQSDATGNSEAVLCCTPFDLYPHQRSCSYEWTVPGNRNKTTLAVKNLCDDLKGAAPITAPVEIWYVSLKGDPSNPLYRVDCRTNQATALSTPSSSAPPVSPPPASPPTQQVAKPQEAPDTSDPKIRPAVAKLNDRVDELEKTLKDQRRSVQNLQEELGNLRSTGGRDLEKQLKEILDRLRALEEAQKSSCFRIDDRYKGQEEVLIAVAGGVLRFVKIKPRSSTVAIGLSEAKANELLAAAQAESKHEIFPHILLSVPEAVREVKPFFLQDRLIDPQLYSRLTNGKNANRVAYQDVQRFIADLNSRCNGRAQFVLPSEEQFVAAAQELYDPVANGLKPCEALRDQDRRFEVTELFSHAWQLTRSLCVPFSDPPRTACPDGSSYIRKGGAASSTDRLECMPEYRGLAPFDVNQQETSFRLALAE